MSILEFISQVYLPKVIKYWQSKFHIMLQIFLNPIEQQYTGIMNLVNIWILVGNSELENLSELNWVPNK